MSKNWLCRLFSLLLAVMMVCTLLPAAAFAEEGVEQPPASEQPSGSYDVEEPQKPAGASGDDEELQEPAGVSIDGEEPQEPAGASGDDEEPQKPAGAFMALPESDVITTDTNAPAKPGESEIAAALANPAVILRCTTGNHESYRAFGYVKDAKYDVTEPKLENGSYTCTLTIYAAGYVSNMNVTIPHLKHTLNDEESKTIKLTYDSAGKKWTASPGSVTFNVSCPAQKPTKPSDLELYDKFDVHVVCDTDSTNHPAQKITPQPRSFTVGEVEGNETDGYTCTVTVNADAYVRIFIDRNPAWSHALVPTEESSKTFILRRVGKEWKLPDDLNITFHVKCVPYCFVYYTDGVDNEEVFDNQVHRVAMGDPTPAFEGTPTREGYDFAGWEPEVAATVTEYYTYYTAKWTKQAPKAPTNAEVEGLLSKKAVKVSCNHSAHVSFDTRSLAEGKYEILGVTQENGDYYCTIKLDPLSYASDSATGLFHKLDPENQNPTIQLKYNTTTEAWTVQTSTPVVITVICAYTVTYTDGVGGTAFANQVYSDLKYGDATPEFNGTPTRQDYIFDGWSPTVDTVVDWDMTYTAKWRLNTPDAPSEDEINTLLDGKVRVECTNIHTSKTKNLIAGTYTTGNVVYDADGGFTCQIKITDLEAYVKAFCTDHSGVTHTLSSVTPEDAAITLKYVNGEWTLPGGSDVTITTSCSAFPDAPTKEELEKYFSFIRINLTCTSHKDGPCGCLLEEGNYRISSVTKEGSDYYCFIEFDLPSYAAASSFLSSSAPHKLTSENQKNTIKLKYNKGLYGKWDNGGDNRLTVFVTCAYTVTYTDGVDGEEIFPDEATEVIYGKATPAFTGGTPKRTGYVFDGWNPAVSQTVTGDVTYTAKWEADVNGNGIADKDEETYTVTYTDGVGGTAFGNQVYGRLLSGTDTPAFSGEPTRRGYTFAGWNPRVADTVTKDVTYTATWKAVNTKVAQTGDDGMALVYGGLMLLSLCGAAAVCVIARKRRHG